MLEKPDRADSAGRSNQTGRSGSAARRVDSTLLALLTDPGMPRWEIIDRGRWTTALLVAFSAWIALYAWILFRPDGWRRRYEDAPPAGPLFGAAVIDSADVDDANGGERLTAESAANSRGELSWHDLPPCATMPEFASDFPLPMPDESPRAAARRIARLSKPGNRQSPDSVPNLTHFTSAPAHESLLDEPILASPNSSDPVLHDPARNGPTAPGDDQKPDQKPDQKRHEDPLVEPILPGRSTAAPGSAAPGRTPDGSPRTAPNDPSRGPGGGENSDDAATKSTGDDPHAELLAKSCYPSARECAACHQQIYDEWALSNHAYTAVSPMFHRFEQKLNDLARGTIGYFCMRCHAPVATSMGISRDVPVWDLPLVGREGVTCVACHRVQYQYGKVNGERRIETGDITAPVLGPIGGDGVRQAIERAEELKIKLTDDSKKGQRIHQRGIKFEQLSRADYCTSCHQVAVHPGIKLEVVWEQYRASPAYRRGITCQDCHMGKVPGKAEGYSCGPAAIVNGKVVQPLRKHANHLFFGPGYSIAHPGLFPHNPKADRWTIPQWLEFDFRAGWGTKEFERRLSAGEFKVAFPSIWEDADDRADARDIVEANLKRLHLKQDLRRETLENGSRIDGPFFQSDQTAGRPLAFHYVVTNTNDGHNLPTGSLGAQPQLWLNVSLIGPDGSRVWESGHLDSLGDLCDIHSQDVRNHRLPFDRSLFNLQTMFLITGAKGTDREFFLPVNLDIDQLPFIRPGNQPITTINHPPFIRMEGRSLAPLGSRQAVYRVPGELLQQPGIYRLSVRMRSRGEPLYFMRFVDSTPEMMRSMNEWIADVHENSTEFEVR